MAADTASIDAVAFLQVRRDPRLLRLVSVGQTQLGAEHFGLLVDLPTHHVCLRCIPQTGRAAGERAFQVLLMKSRMARFAQRHQVVRAITTRFPRLYMVDGENRIVGLPVTPLATMLIAPEHILPGIPKIVLRSVLILLSCNRGIVELLQIELRDFNGGAAHWQDRVHQPDGAEMACHLVPHRGCKPPLGLLSIRIPCWPVARLAASSRAAVLPAGRQSCPNIRAWVNFRLEEHLLLRRGGDANMPSTCIDAQFDLLPIAATPVEQLQRKRDRMNHFGLTCLQQQAGFAWGAWHEWLPMLIDHVDEHSVYLPSE